MRNDHLIFMVREPDRSKQDHPVPTILERDSLVKSALQARVDTVTQKLQSERDVRDYLVSQGKTMAVARVDRNIANIQLTLDSYRKDLDAHGKE